MLLKRINKFSKVITEPIIKLSNQTSEIKSAYSKIEFINTDIKEIAQLNYNFSNMMNELKESSNRLYEAKNIAEKLAKAKDDFMANMSHELKTPLNSINVISELMKSNNSGNLDEKQIKSLEIINKCGKDLLFLINDVLDISKLEAGEIKLDYTILDINELMTNIYDMFHSQAEEKNIDLVYEIDDTLKEIFSDEVRVKQIVKNLLSNALKFTANNKRVVFSVKDEGENIKIVVEDEGIGISENKLEYIFDRFKQADSSTTRKYGGTGLGLAICKDLVKLLDGNITATSKEGVGSRFEVTISKNIQKLQKQKRKNNVIEEHAMVKKERIILHNSDPIGFLTIAQEIKKYFEFRLASNLNEILNEYKKESSKIIVDQDRLTKDDMELIKENIDYKDLIVIYETELKDIYKGAYKSIKKPLKIDALLE